MRWKIAVNAVDPMVPCALSCAVLTVMGRVDEKALGDHPPQELSAQKMKEEEPQPPIPALPFWSLMGPHAELRWVSEYRLMVTSLHWCHQAMENLGPQSREE